MILLVEDSIREEKADTVQFERFGFVRIEKKDPQKIVAVYTHD